MEINVSEAKAQLSKLINMVHRGERVVICKNNLPLADLVPHKSQRKRRLGLLQGKWSTTHDLLQQDPDVEAMFYGNESISGKTVLRL
jgi:prevent-host-death family protein